MNRPVRLQKYLAECGVASRRKAEALIAAGRVSVDGLVVTTMGLKVDPGRQTICCDGEPVCRPQRLVYILLNKPKGFVTTLSDPQGRPVVRSLLTGVDERVFPVGRLDIDSEGALLFTNDGALAQKVLHPSFETTKTYEVVISGTLNTTRVNRLEQGILLDGRRTWPARLTIVREKNSASVIRIVIHEGRKRQVRKMFKAIGRPVVSLKRIAYGRLELGSLKPGSYRFLTAREVEKIFL